MDSAILTQIYGRAAVFHSLFWPTCTLIGGTLIIAMVKLTQYLSIMCERLSRIKRWWIERLSVSESSQWTSEVHKWSSCMRPDVDDLWQLGFNNNDIQQQLKGGTHTVMLRQDWGWTDVGLQLDTNGSKWWLQLLQWLSTLCLLASFISLNIWKCDILYFGRNSASVHYINILGLLFFFFFYPVSIILYIRSHSH